MAAGAQLESISPAGRLKLAAACWLLIFCVLLLIAAVLWKEQQQQRQPNQPTNRRGA